MEKRFRILPLLLSALLILSVLLLPASKAAAEEDPAQLPTVFVHGYTGWGDYDRMNDTLPYWGLLSGDLLDNLNSSGYHCYAASVGPLSSAWDRACELYAQLTGTRTDYGIAHARKYGHERYGRDFTGQALIPDFTWDRAHRINLVGHSFGGTACRMLIDLLYDGAQEEVAAAQAAGETVSPLFEGGHSGMVHSFTSLATPFNGSSFHYANVAATVLGPEMFRAIGTAAQLTVPGIYDPMLDQFGIGYDPDRNILEIFEEILSSDFYDHNDSCIPDMTIEKATDMNRSLELRPDIYYFVHYGNKTSKNTVTGTVSPSLDVFPVLLPLSIGMCSYTGRTNSSYPDGYGDTYTEVSVPSIPLDEEWKYNDGINNVVSGYCPFTLNADGSRVYDAHVEYTGGMRFTPGKWIIFPVHEMDHFAVIGWNPLVSTGEVRGLYQDIMTTIHETVSGSSADSSGIEPGCPTAQFTDMDHNGWYHSFIDYVVQNGLMSGTSATTFSPEGTVTRAMVAQTLYAMAGKPAGAGNAGFRDVSPTAWYADAVNWCAGSGVVSGYEDRTFRPDENITREQLATMFRAYARSRGADVTAAADLSGYADASAVSAYAAEPMRWAVASGLIGGRQTDAGLLLCPRDTATRAELAVMLRNLKEKIV